MTTFTSDDREEAYRKKVEEAPYHPGYEGAVVKPNPVYRGVDPAKMIWKEKPITAENIKSRIKHSLCGGPVSIQSRVYFDDEEISFLKMTHEEANTGEKK